MCPDGIVYQGHKARTNRQGIAVSEGPFLPKDKAFYQFEKRIRKELVPMIERSGMTISMVPTGETDVKFAVELGLSIMLDKPIIALVLPGATVPPKLRQIADEVVVADLLGDPEDAQRVINEAMDRVATRYNL